jgi:hypothetical protein
LSEFPNKPLTQIDLYLILSVIGNTELPQEKQVMKTELYRSRPDRVRCKVTINHVYFIGVGETPQKAYRVAMRRMRQEICMDVEGHLFDIERDLPADHPAVIAAKKATASNYQYGGRDIPFHLEDYTDPTISVRGGRHG